MSDGVNICITSDGDNLDANVDPRFGRCLYFLIVNIDTMDFEALKNPNINTMGGAGIQSGQLVTEKKVKAVLTGNVGPNAFQTLNASGIDVLTGVSGKIKDVIERYKKGEFKSTQGPSVNSKFGMPPTQ